MSDFKSLYTTSEGNRRVERESITNGDRPQQLSKTRLVNEHNERLYKITMLKRVYSVSRTGSASERSKRTGRSSIAIEQGLRVEITTSITSNRNNFSNKLNNFSNKY